MLKRPAPAPAKRTPSNPSSGPSSFRPAPAPPQTVSPSLDRSTSQRLPSKSPNQSQQLSRSNTTKDSPPPGPQNGHGLVPGKHPHKSPVSSTTDLPLKQPSKDRERTPPQPSAAANQLHKTANAAGVATPRKREKKDKDKAKDDDVIRRLQQICTDADPTKLYRNLVKIGAG